MTVVAKTTSASSSYRSILKSTSLIGGASIINILIGMVRNKFVAVLLGPSGIGLIGMYTQITTLASTITGMGISNSGVRQVAEAVGSSDDELIARTVISLRRTAWGTGLLGLLGMICFSIPLSRITFGNNDYAMPIAILGITIFAGAIAGGQASIINGTRRLADLAKINVIGGLNGTIISIPCFYIWGQAGIIPSLVLSSIAALITSWWFSKRVVVKQIELSWQDSFVESKHLLSLGVSFMGAGLVSALATYLIQIIMLRQFGLTNVGIYQAAFNLSGMLAGFVLGAMGTDYYPRLTAVAGDNLTVHRMVNEQSQISILLALPGLAAMMIFAPLIIKLFYSASFTPAIPVLRWCVLGILGRVFAWPMGFVMLAKGNGKLFFITEVFGAGFHVGALFLLVQVFGLNGAGIAFTVVYIVYTCLMLFVMQRLVGATWTSETIKLSLFSSIIMIVLMLNSTLNIGPVVWILNLPVFAGATYFSFKQLSQKTGVSLKTFISQFSKK